MMRINKYLALCGLGARRKVEILVTEGRVRINGRPVTDLSARVDPEADIVAVNRRRVYPVSKLIYIMVNKPKGVITSMEDVHGRPIVIDLIPPRFRGEGVFPVGRLDLDTEGLLLLTNDGEMAFKLTHPRFGIPKEYIVELDRPLDQKDKARIEKGVHMYGLRTNPAALYPLAGSSQNLKMVITEGKKRQIRITFRHFGYKVKKLKRIAFGPVRLSGVNTGSYRLLKEKEIKALRSALSRSQTVPAENFS
jgi:pseudouridine synthase